MATRTRVVGVRLDPQDVERLAMLASRQGISTAMMARILLLAAMRRAGGKAETRMTK